MALMTLLLLPRIKLLLEQNLICEREIPDNETLECPMRHVLLSPVDTLVTLDRNKRVLMTAAVFNTGSSWFSSQRFSPSCWLWIA